jgi:hypothetical protein
MWLLSWFDYDVEQELYRTIAPGAQRAGWAKRLIRALMSLLLC